MKIRIPNDLQSLLVPLADIRLDPANANEHDDAGIQDIVMSIAEFGFDQPVLLRQDGQLIAGEGRYLAAQSLGMEAIPAVRTPLNSIDATRRGIGDNVIARKSKLNEEKLAALLASLRNEDEKLLRGTGYDDTALDHLLKAVTPPNLDDLEDEFGERNETDFWPVIRVKVSPETHAQYQAVMEQIEGDDEATKFDTLVSMASAALSGSVLP